MTWYRQAIRFDCVRMAHEHSSPACPDNAFAVAHSDIDYNPEDYCWVHGVRHGWVLSCSACYPGLRWALGLSYSGTNKCEAARKGL